jgi:transcriptional regulator with XRE-family HTH domain
MGVREDAELLAIKKSIALQLHRAMKRAKLSQDGLASRMKTSRTVIGRMLNPRDTGVTLATLNKVSRALGLSVDIRLVASHRRAA